MIKSIVKTVAAAVASVIAAQHTVSAADISFSEAELQAGRDIETHAVGKTSGDSVFQIGSISKFACTLAILDLHHKGRLNIDAVIADVLPGYRGAAGGRVKVSHLLQNRSGLKDGIIAAFRADQSLATTSIPSLQAANRFASSAPKFEPGSQFDYIIANWIIVQAILEHVDGAPVGNVLKTRVFDPAGMRHTSVFDGVLAGANVAPPVTPARPVPDFLTCAGGFASTATDLVKLVRHPYHTAGFSSDVLMQLTAIATAEENYALGGRYISMKQDGKDHILSWQSGSNGAYKSIAVYDPVLDFGYAIATADDARTAIERRRDAWMERVYEQ